MAAGSTVDEFARLRHLAETQRLLRSGAVGPVRLLEVVAERAQSITCADAGVVELLDSDELVCRASTGSIQGSLGVRLKVASTISGRCLRLAVPMRCVDTEYDTRVERTSCRQLGIRSMVVVPILKGGSAVGVLKVTSAQPDHFGEPDVEVLQEMAGFVAEVVANPPPPRGPGGANTEVPTLADRQLFAQCLDQACAAAERDGTALAVFLIRLEGTVPGQDRVLRLVAESLTRVVRTGDVLIRLGDEFVLICSDARESDSYGIMARISSAVRRVADSDPDYDQLSAGVGLAWRDERNRNAEDLLSAARAALVTAG